MANINAGIAPARLRLRTARRRSRARRWLGWRTPSRATSCSLVGTSPRSRRSRATPHSRLATLGPARRLTTTVTRLRACRRHGSSRRCRSRRSSPAPPTSIPARAHRITDSAAASLRKLLHSILMVSHATGDQPWRSTSRQATTLARARQEVLAAEDQDPGRGDLDERRKERRVSSSIKGAGQNPFKGVRREKSRSKALGDGLQLRSESRFGKRFDHLTSPRTLGLRVC